jgi:hypothetical protein
VALDAHHPCKKIARSNSPKSSSEPNGNFAIASTLVSPASICCFF